MKKSMMDRVRPFVTTLMLVSMVFILYPTISSLWNDYCQSRVVTSYQEPSKETVDYEAERQKALDYNEKLSVKDKHIINTSNYDKSDEYEALLNIHNDGSMGYINIPKIAVRLPIYHYYDEDNVEGLGHIYGTSLPVGELNTHSVLAAHRGVPSARLFTNLDEMELGDIFYVHSLDKTMTYQVVEIKTVLPTDIKDIVIEEDRDLVTLVTCTPYSVNTHRLLVTGERIEDRAEEAPDVVSKITHLIDRSQIVSLIMFVIMLSFIIILNRKGKQSETKKVNNAND